MLKLKLLKSSNPEAKALGPWYVEATVNGATYSTEYAKTKWAARKLAFALLATLGFSPSAVMAEAL